MKEYLLTTDEYLTPKVVEDSDAYAILLIRLLLLNPGTNPDHPNMGVGLTKYRFIMEDNLGDLQTLIQEQVNTYLAEEFNSAVQVYLEIKPSKYILITIIANGVKYVYDTEVSDSPVQLSDIMS